MEKANNKLKLKLFIDKKSAKVLFGEARRDLVDFIFRLLALPLGAFTKFLTKDDAIVGSIGEVYDSLSKINGTYIVSYGQQSSLLNPPDLATTSNYITNFFLHPISTYQDTKDRCVYICYNSSYKCCPYVSLVKGAPCLGCGTSMSLQIQFNEYCQDDAGTVVEVSSEGKGKEGYVEGEMTFSVMDDLTMAPMSTLSSNALLNKFGIQDLGSIQEITVTVGFEEGLKLLKASLESKTVLTDVFLKKNSASNA